MDKQIENNLNLSLETPIEGEKKKKTRSRTGCQQCKKIKKKCDERKPFCSYCIKKGIQDMCNYTIPIKLKTANKKIKKPNKNFVRNEKNNNNHHPNHIKIENTKNGTDFDVFQLHNPNTVESVQNELALNTDISDLIPKEIFLTELGGRFTLPISKSTTSTLNSFTNKEEHKALDEEEDDQKIIEINVNEMKQGQEVQLVYNERGLSSTEQFDLMPTPIPIISQTRAYQSYLPFNISFRNQKILNFYETFTSSFLTPGFHFNENTLSPFKQYIPKFVNTDKDLMKLILFFAKTHMGQLGIDYADPYMLGDTDGDDITADDPMSLANSSNTVLNSESSSGLSFLDRIASQDAKDVSDEELGTYALKQMVLISLHTFFPGISTINWRKCMQNAKTGILHISENSEMFSFLNHWLCYQELMSSLTTSNLQLIDANNFEYQFDDDDKDTSFPLSTTNITKKFDETSLDIDKFSGMDRQTLKYLNKGVKLLQKFNTKDVNTKLEVQLETMELIIEMEKYTIVSELQRDQMITDDMNLRTTNKIFGKITLYLLKRRILNIQIVNNAKIRESLIEIIDLIEQLPFNTAYSSCVFFAMFISGCDLIIFDSLIKKRQIILAHLESLYKNVGMESCQRVTNYMLQCWLTKKPWWEVFIDNDIDIIFTI